VSERSTYLRDQAAKPVGPGGAVGVTRRGVIGKRRIPRRRQPTRTRWGFSTGSASIEAVLDKYEELARQEI
jgi:hypothetical protein